MQRLVVQPRHFLERIEDESFWLECPLFADELVCRPSDVLDVLVLEPRRQITCNIGCAVVAEQWWPLRDSDVIEARRRKRLIERGRDV